MATTHYFVKNEPGISPRFQTIRKVGNLAEVAKLKADDKYVELKLTPTEEARLKSIHGDICQGDVLDRYTKN